MSDGVEKLRPINPGENIKITDDNRRGKREQRHNPKAHEAFDRLLHKREEELTEKENPKPQKKAGYKNGKRVF